MSPTPLPILTLRLSSPSFLETVLTDNGRPLYSTETAGNATCLYRCDPYTGLALVASIRWPHLPARAKDVAPAQIFVDGASRSEDELLKRNRLNTARKFRIPGHSSPLKWRRAQGGIFQCTSSSGVPVAVFEPAILTAHARLSVFVPFLTGLPEPQGGGVSSILVDYLIVTALLLLTHPEDWHGLACTQRASSSSLHLEIPKSAYPPSMPFYETPISPIASSFSDSSERQSRLSPITTSFSWDGGHTSSTLASSVSASSSASSSSSSYSHSHSKDEEIDFEPPPPYEEIQWTVRVRQPRRQHKETAF